MCQIGKMLLIDIYSETTVGITTVYNESHLKYLILRSVDPLNGYSTHSKMIIRINLRDRTTPVTDCSSYTSIMLLCFYFYLSRSSHLFAHNRIYRNINKKQHIIFNN